MAVIKPAEASTPLDTPNAMARGRATAATVRPDSRSLKIFRDYKTEILILIVGNKMNAH